MVVNWTSGEVLLGGSTAPPFPVIKLLLSKLPYPDFSGLVPEHYLDFVNVFCLKQAVTLPPYNCLTNLLLGTTTPRGRVYSLYLLETEAMFIYIHVYLSKGLILKSLPAVAGFFFVGKKDGFLHRVLIIGA